LLDNPGINVYPLVKKLLHFKKGKGIVALHDPTEGGIATAIHELADASGCGVTIHYEQIPFLTETKTIAQLFRLNPLGLLASGCLLIACHSKETSSLLQKFSKESLKWVGTFTRESKRFCLINGRKQPLPRFDQDEIIKAIFLKKRTIHGEY
jgi:hydrogenase maturation factor